MKQKRLAAVVFVVRDGNSALSVTEFPVKCLIPHIAPRLLCRKPELFRQHFHVLLDQCKRDVVCAAELFHVCGIRCGIRPYQVVDMISRSIIKRHTESAPPDTPATTQSPSSIIWYSLIYRTTLFIICLPFMRLSHQRRIFQTSMRFFIMQVSTVMSSLMRPP